jgi:hypothetical protein
MSFHPQTINPDTAADIIAIQQLAVLYAYALDARQYDLLDEIFAADAQLHMSSGAHMTPSQYRAMCEVELPKLDATHHITTNTVVTVDGDRGRSRSYFQAQHVKRALAPDPYFLMAGWVDDIVERRSDRWCIVERTWTSVWSTGNPAVLGR